MHRYVPTILALLCVVVLSCGCESSSSESPALTLTAQDNGRTVQMLNGEGLRVILCSEGDFTEASSIRDKIACESGFFNPDQFSNPLNVECHYETTAQEILQQIKPYADELEAFVSGVGTGGTLIGCGKRLKEAFPSIKIVAVEPSESPVLSGGNPGLHGIQGIGDGFVPSIPRTACRCRSQR